MMHQQVLTAIQQRRQGGFTLLEIMLALGLTSVLMLGAMTFLRQGVDAWTKSDVIIRESERELIAMNFLRKTISQAYSVDVGLGKDEAEAIGAESGKSEMTAFWGESDKVYMVGPLPVHHGKPMGLYLFGFMVENVAESDSSALVVKYWPINWESIGQTMAAEPGYEMLLDGVESISLEYFGEAEEPEAVDTQELGEPVLEWTGSWTEREELPLAVRLNLTRLEFDEDSERPPLPNWQDIYIKVAHRYIK